MGGIHGDPGKVHCFHTSYLLERFQNERGSAAVGSADDEVDRSYAGFAL